MNDYRITYTTEAGDSFDSIITERTEAAARKFFTSMNKRKTTTWPAKRKRSERSRMPPDRPSCST